MPSALQRSSAAPPFGLPRLNRDSIQAQGLLLWYPGLLTAFAGMRDFGPYRFDAAFSGTGGPVEDISIDGSVAVNFDGSASGDACVDTGAISTGIIDLSSGSSKYWVSLWALPSAIPDSVFDSQLFEHGTATMSDGWGVVTSPGPGNTGVQVYTVGNNSGFQSTVPNGELHHWAFLFDQSATRVAIWKDGALVYSNTSYANTSAATNAKFVIGGRTGGIDIPFDGLIYDVRLYQGGSPDAVVPVIYDPVTRWDLFYRSKRVFSIPAAAAASTIPVFDHHYRAMRAA